MNIVQANRGYLSHIKRSLLFMVFALVILPTVTSGMTNNKDSSINTLQKGYMISTDTEMTVDFTGTNFKDTSCYVLNGKTANPLFVPTRTEAEWLEFYNWAMNPNNGVTIVPCKSTYTDTWSAGSCSTTCGSGTIQGAVCSGTKCDPGVNPNGSSCSSYATCSCAAAGSNATLCTGQNTNFSSAPPVVSYVNSGACNGSTKCQASCNVGYTPGAGGCVSAVQTFTGTGCSSCPFGTHPSLINIGAAYGMQATICNYNGMSGSIQAGGVWGQRRNSDPVGLTTVGSYGPVCFFFYITGTGNHVQGSDTNTTWTLTNSTIPQEKSSCGLAVSSPYFCQP